MTEQEKQKQIEEIANWLKSAITDTLHDCVTDCENCDNKYKSFGMADCLTMNEVEILIDAGYGDTKQAVRDFAEKLKREFIEGDGTCLDEYDIGFSEGYNVACKEHKARVDDLVKEICGE